MADRVKYTEGEQIVTEDLKDCQSLHEQYVYDYILRRLLGDPASAVFFGTDCLVTAVAGMNVQIDPGRGFQYVSGETDADEPKFKPIVVAAAQSITVATADGAEARKDIVCIKAARDDAQAESRYIMAVGGAITTQSVYKRSMATFDYQYVEGTPDTPPLEPSVPAGYVKIAVIDVAAGAGSITQANITDSRIGLFLSQPFLNLPDTWSAGSVQTTDATVTDLATVAVAEGDLVMVETSVVGRKSDGSALYSGKIVGTFYRNAGGNVTQAGGASLTDEVNDSSWGGIDLVADTAAQTVDLRVTGLAGTTIDWVGSVKVTKVSG